MTVPSEPGMPLAPPDDIATAPATGWRWGLRRFGTPRQYAVLALGAVLLAIGVATSITAGLGVGSWQVFETGLMATTGASFAVVAVIESLLVLAIAWWWLGQTPGPATVLFALGVGPLVGFFLGLVPAVETVAGQAVLLTIGTVGIGMGVGFYIGAALGASAQDSLFVGLFTKYRLRPRDARLGTDLSLVLAGWALGGQVGVGTVVLTLALPLVVEPGMRVGGRLAGLAPDPAVDPRAVVSP